MKEERFEEAAPLFERTIALTETSMGKDSVRVERALRNYATLLRKMGREEEAAQQENRANAIKEKNNPATQSG